MHQFLVSAGKLVFVTDRGWGLFPRRIGFPGVPRDYTQWGRHRGYSVTPVLAHPVNPNTERESHVWGVTGASIGDVLYRLVGELDAVGPGPTECVRGLSMSQFFQHFAA